MALLMVVWCCCRYWSADSKTSVLIEEFWGRDRVLAAFPNFWCCSERWSGLSHPDWVKIFGDPNGQIKLRAKQKIRSFFCYSINLSALPIMTHKLDDITVYKRRLIASEPIGLVITSARNWLPLNAVNYIYAIRHRFTLCNHSIK